MGGKFHILYRDLMIMKKNLERFFFDRATWMGKPLKSDDFDLVLTDHGVCFTYRGNEHSNGVTTTGNS